MTAEERQTLPPAGLGSGPAAPVVEHVADIGRFRVRRDGRDLAVLDYQAGPGFWNLVHTWADPSVRGTGLASSLVRQVMDQARAEGLKVIPSCPYIPAWLRRNPEYADLVSTW